MTTLADIVRVLSTTAAYPEPAASVEVAQTQMSVVFIAGDYVYKVKKPVNLGYLDYTTLEQRKHFCDQELKLNRRLCPDVYLDVVPIAVVEGKITLGGAGEPVEYAVKMKKLPRDGMMDVLLAQNKVTPEMITRVAEKVTAFHASARTSPKIGEFGSIETIRTNTEENFSQTIKYIPKVIPPDQFRTLANFSRDFIEDRGLLLRQRVGQRRIKDCHGDLHAQHVCFTDSGICIYDCIEFNDRFRYVDVAAEVSFLAMDLDRWGHAELSKRFVGAYVEKSGDADLPALLNFYKCYFAYVRGKVNCFRLDDAMQSADDKAKALADAKKYFALAEQYAEG